MNARARKIMAAVAAAIFTAPLAACSYYIVGDRDYSSVAFVDPQVSETAILESAKAFVYGDPLIEISADMTAHADILDRTAFTAGSDGAPTRGERAAAERIEALFADAGYPARGTETQAEDAYSESRSFTRQVKQSSGIFTSTVREVTSQNVVAVLPASGKNLGTLIIGTHYDNRYGSDLLEGERGHGVYSGGLGVGALVTIARLAKQNPRPYEVKFVAFGAGEPGNYGSQEYVEQMSAAEKKETMLMFNLDLLGGGDYLYLFCDDAETAHEDYLRAACEKTAPVVRRPPKDKRVILSNGSTETYTHYGYMGDNHAFYRAGIPCAALFGLNWEVKNVYGIVESASKKAMLGTEEDTLYTVSERYPDYLQKSASAANLVLSVLNADGEEFEAVMRFSRETRRSVEWLTNTRIQMYIYGGTVIVLAVVAGIVAGILAKRRPRSEDRIEIREDDIFGSDGQSSQNTGDGDNPFKGY